MNIWVVKTSEMLASDNANGRLLRSGLIAHMLDARGHAVTWWMSTFDHANRRNRASRDEAARFATRGTIRMLYSPGYRRSISLGRLWDHALWGRRFARAIAAAPAPDLIFCAFPTIEAAFACSRFGQERGIPVVIDLRDMWPDIFVERLPAAFGSLARTSLWPIRRRAHLALREATTLFGITEEFVDWGLGIARRSRREWDCAFPLAYPHTQLTGATDSDRDRAMEFWDRLAVRGGDAFNVVLIGTMTRRRFDMETVLTAARTLATDARQVRFIIAGDGDELARFRSYAAGCPNVVFPGWLSTAQIRELLARAHIGLVPYRNTPDLTISIPNKVAEYLAAPVPVVTCLQGTLSKLLRDRQCGAEFTQGRPETLVQVVRQLRDNEDHRARLASNARSTFETSFAAETVYGRLIERLEMIAGASTSGHLARNATEGPAPSGEPRPSAALGISTRGRPRFGAS